MRQKKEKKISFLRTPLFLFGSLALLFIFVMINFKHIAVYLVLLGISALIQYKHYRGFPKLNLGHIYFIAFVIGWHDGMEGEILFVILAGLFPELLAGYVEMKTFIVYPIMIGFISLPLTFMKSEFILIGIVSSILYHSIVFWISILTKEPLPERLFEIIIPCILNILYFMYLAYPLYNLLDFII